MILNGEEYSKKLATFSDSTIELLSQIMTLPKEAVYKANSIIANSELSEKQVVEQLQKFKEEYKDHTSK